jgi:3-oxocholest-4-en-26-oate---CoA ligase
VIDREGVTVIAIVGDVFARPILAALDAEPLRWDISSLRMITSSGAMMAPETKEGLLRHNHRLIVVDTLGSTAVIGLARSVVSDWRCGTDDRRGVHSRARDPRPRRGRP